MALLDGHLLALLVVAVAVALLLVVGRALGLVLGVVHSLVVRLTLFETKEMTLAYVCNACKLIEVQFS